MEELLNLLSEVPTKKYKGTIWFKAGPLVTKYFKKSIVAQFIVRLNVNEDYRDFSLGNRNRDIYISLRGLIKAILITSEQSIHTSLKDYRGKFIDLLYNDLSTSKAFSAIELETVEESASISIKKSQEYNPVKIKKSIQKFFRKKQRWNNFFSASELYPKVRALQSDSSKNHLIYATSVLDSLADQGFLEVSEKPRTKVRTYRIDPKYVNLEIG